MQAHSPPRWFASCMIHEQCHYHSLSFLTDASVITAPQISMLDLGQKEFRKERPRSIEDRFRSRITTSIFQPSG